MTPPVSLRERKKAKLREALIDAAYRLFLKKGYQATTLMDISRACGVTVPTLLRYFGSKEDLLFSRQAEILADFRQQLSAAAAAANASVPFFVAFIHDMSVRLDRNKEIRNIYRIIRGVPSLLAKFHAIIRQYEEALEQALSAEAGADAGEDLHATLLAHLLTAGLITESLRVIASGRDAPLSARNDAVAGYILKNFTRPTALTPSGARSRRETTPRRRTPRSVRRQV
jgi:AcrR family transcriptional regulator